VVDVTFNINKHCWDGRGGPRGLVTHVWDRSFLYIKNEIEKGGHGRYRVRFERIGEETMEKDSTFRGEIDANA
jgi:hypothetical protein